jgi:hypothetical protein
MHTVLCLYVLQTASSSQCCIIASQESNLPCSASLWQSAADRIEWGNRLAIRTEVAHYVNTVHGTDIEFS